jgi:urease accessory protein
MRASAVFEQRQPPDDQWLDHQGDEGVVAPPGARISTPTLTGADETTETPHLDLSFRRHPVHGTWLDRRVFRWPYTLSRGFRADGDRLMLIRQTMSGAIQAGDTLVQRIHVGPWAAVHLATQGAMPVHRARVGRAARDEIALRVQDSGSIEYMPDLRILFPDASLSQRVCLRLAESATAIIADGFVMHDPEGRGRPFRQYSSEFLVQRPTGRVLAVDRTALVAPPGSRGKRGLYVAFGTLIVAVSRPIGWLEAFCADADARLAQLAGVYAAASALPNGAGAAVRIAATDGRHLRLGLQTGWSAARLHLSGYEARAN